MASPESSYSKTDYPPAYGLQTTSEASEIAPDQLETAEAKHASHLHRRLGLAKRTVQGAIIATEVNHFTNEGLRLAAFGATLGETHNAALGALVLGGSTLVIEGSAALATAGILASDKTSQVVRKLNNIGKKVVPEGSKIPPPAEFGVAMLAGTPALMTLKNIAEPERTLTQNRRHGLFTASWLATLVGVGGEVFGKSIEKYSTDPKVWGAGVVAVGGLALAVKFSKSLVKKNQEQTNFIPELKNINPEFGYTVKLTANHSSTEAQKALELEQSIWNENDYGSLDEYLKYLDQSRIFTAWDDDKCIGVTRVFEGRPHLPPFMDLPITDPNARQALESNCQAGLVEELGTAAVPKSERPKRIALELWRLAYRDARARGIKGWGIIMEPKRVAVMNGRYDFTFEQLGPTVNYQGGDCAVHYLDLEEVDRRMQVDNPGLYEWFVKESLSG